MQNTIDRIKIYCSTDKSKTFSFFKVMHSNQQNNSFSHRSPSPRLSLEPAQPNSASNALNQSWPPMQTTHTEDETNKRPLSMRATKLAPISSHPLPRPPSYK